MDEFDIVAQNARQLDAMYDTQTTRALMEAVVALRERLEDEGLMECVDQGDDQC